MGHVFGLVYDFLYGVCFGVPTVISLTRMPSPKVIMTTVAGHPSPYPFLRAISYRKRFSKRRSSRKSTANWANCSCTSPSSTRKSKERARTESLRLFGGNIKEVIIGGAPFNAEVEAFVPLYQFPLFHRLRHDGMRPHHLPQPVVRNSLYVVRKGGRRYGTESAEFRPRTDSR